MTEDEKRLIEFGLERVEVCKVKQEEKTHYREDDCK